MANLKHRAQGAGVGLLVAAAVVGGGYAARELTSGGASTAFEQRQGETNARVPFLGPFAHNRKGITECGPAVRLMEGALRNTKPPVRKTPAARCVGVAAERQIKAFQKRHGIPQTGIYGERTHDALAIRYTRQQRIDLQYLESLRIDAKRRSTILVVTSHAYALRGLMGYCNHGSLASCSLRSVWPPYPDVPRHTDCSGYVSWVLYQSGVPNPNGVGVGNTTSLARRGTAVSPNGPLRVGDLVFYSYNNSHVAIYIGHGLVSSHGRPGLDIHPYGYRPIYAIRRYF